MVAKPRPKAAAVSVKRRVVAVVKWAARVAVVDAWVAVAYAVAVVDVEEEVVVVDAAVVVIGADRKNTERTERERYRSRSLLRTDRWA